MSSTNKVFTQVASNRGMFDPDDDVLPQGIFDTAIFDTQLVEALTTHPILPAIVHSNSTKTTLVHGTELKTIQ